MRSSHWLSTVLALATGVASACANDPIKIDSPLVVDRANDLTKISRTLVKEPAYQTRDPQYCLLVFGPEVRTRIWLVLDGGTLYVDRNGNGDLTEAGERVAAGPTGCFDVGDLIEQPGGTRHTSLKVFRDPKLGVSLSVRAAGYRLQKVYGLKGAGRPGQAPLVHLNGPVTLRLNPPQEVVRGGTNLINIGLGPSGVVRRGRDAYLSGALGTPGLGEGTFALYKPSEVLPRPRLAVEVEFPAEGKDESPLRVKGFLPPDDDFGIELAGTVRVPDRAKLGRIKITVSLLEGKDIRGVPLTLEVLSKSEFPGTGK